MDTENQKLESSSLISLLWGLNEIIGATRTIEGSA
jgi:hypothetical protein